MKKIKFYNSIVFKAALAVVLLFSIFIAFSYDLLIQNLILYRSFMVFSLICLVVTIFVAQRLSGVIFKVSKQVEDYANKNYSERKNISGNNEITLLYDNVVRLGEEIEKTQDTLESQHNRLNGILTYMTDGVIATDRRGKIVTANAAALTMLGLNEKKILNKRIVDVLKLSSKYSFRDLLTQSPEVIIDRENEMGEYASIQLHFALFRRDNGFISGLVVVLHDVTEQETAERERRLFVANVSHELRTPLTSVKSYLEALEEGAWMDPEIAPNFLAVSLGETDRMIRMISDLLTLSRMDREDMVADKEMVNLVAFLHFQLNRFDQMSVSTGLDKTIKIIRKIPLKPVWVEIDTDQMGQVIDNIMNNAIKYSPEGGTITVSLEDTNNQILLKVTDEGIGIPKKDLPKIFDRFYRVDKDRNRKQGGTGLGLAIVRDVIKLHNGYIWASSDGEHGTTFTIILPYNPTLTEVVTEEDDWG
ncbi:ATP-binding protein [Streptococcaceae bacterium ESL0729]|nr:ATP-binding protein [Streptococcaceae bacterium ESL0729]